ncbi:MAG: hypothetical protein ABI675_15330 [Chitinophagaceae bacterium]
MKVHLTPALRLLSCYMVFIPFSGLVAQPPAHVQNSSNSKKGLFESEDILTITLSGKLREVLNSRVGTPKSLPLNLSYYKEDSSEVIIPVNVKTRGHFRRMRENCVYPPLLIEFSKDKDQLSSIFSEQRKLKLVMPCQEDKYLIREWLVYKIYNLVTPKSFRARLVKVKLDDDRKKKESTPFYGILLEEEKQMAKRNKEVIVERKLLPQQTAPDAFINMAFFQYLIGNTDWSVPYQHNIKLLARDSVTIPFTVPYDFDHAGIVDAPYAYPAEELQMKSVRDRRFRGYCIQNMKEYEEVVALYNRLKNDIYNLYTHCELLEERYIKSTTAYLDEFYKTINNPKALEREFTYPCNNKNGNVVIKGLQE